MNLFVTGGTGYPAALLADGHTVRAYVRSIASAGRLPAHRHALGARRAHSAGRNLYLGANAHGPVCSSRRSCCRPASRP